jgi:hypothetical protein
MIGTDILFVLCSHSRIYISARSFIGELDDLDVMDTEVGGEEEKDGSSNDKGSQTEPGMISSEKEIQTEVFDSRKFMLLNNI